MTPEQARAIALTEAEMRLAMPEAAKDARMGRMRENIAAAKAGTLTMSPARQAEQAAIDQTAEVATRDPGKMTTAALSFGQGATFGFLDEMAAGLASLDPRLSYDDALAYVREVQKNAEAANPKTAIASTVAGGVMSSLAGPAFKAGTTLAGRAGLGALQGGVEGALYGYGTGEGGAQSRAMNALAPAAVGFLAGGAVPMAGTLLKRIAVSMSGMKDGSRAYRAMEELLRKSGMTWDDLNAKLQQARQEGQPQFGAADAMGYTGQRALAGNVRQPGDARQFVAETLDQRQASQGERVGAFLSDAMAVPDTARKQAADTAAARTAVANVDYPAARADAGAVNLSPLIETIDDLIKRNPILGDNGLRKTEIGRRLLGLRSQMIGKGGQLIDFDTVLNIKQDLFGVIKGLERAGKAVPAQIKTIYSGLDNALEAASAGYRQANDNFRAASRVIDAIDTGRAAAAPSVRAADTARTYGALSAPEQAGFRAGYVDPVMAQIEAGGPGRNKALPLMSDKRQAELAMMAQDPALLQRRIARENTMSQTRGIATGGSTTADNLADQAADTAMSSSALSNYLRMGWGEALGAALDRLVSAASGTNPETRALIARALLSNDPASELRAAIPAAQRNAATERLISVLGRSTARTTAERAPLPWVNGPQ